MASGGGGAIVGGIGSNNSEDQWLKEDGYLNVDVEADRIVYHPLLNVILVFTRSSALKVLDVNSGVILQSYAVSETLPPQCRYLPDQDKILFWNGKNISMRGDYNGVLLLDTILQAPISQADDPIRIELPLSEAVLFFQCLQNLEQNGLENTTDVTFELNHKISEAQQFVKRGIKAQKWETICLELPHSSLRMVAGGMVMQLKRLDRHIPALAIASAINERLTDLLEGARVTEPTALNRFHMFSEAVRRQTFEAWPHMDYKWVLPDQMAQAGFYHFPGDNGNGDRAMCFTCNVCLVCWEKTDEPWSEHERHSPECPFVKGDFTQNVPLSVTYASSPAIATPGFTIVSAGEQGNVLCTGNSSADVTIWNLERQLVKVHDFKIKLHPDILATTTLSMDTNVHEIELTALATHYNKSLFAVNKPKTATLSLKPKMLGTKIVCGIRVLSTEPETISSDKETTLLFIVYNIENPINCEQDSPTANSKSKQRLSTLLVSPSSNNIPPAKKSSLSTIDEKYEDDFIKFLSDNTDSQLLESIDKLIDIDIKKDEAHLTQQFAKLDDTLNKLIEASASSTGSSGEEFLSLGKQLPISIGGIGGGTIKLTDSNNQVVSTKPSLAESVSSTGASAGSDADVTTALSTATSLATTNKCEISCIPLQYIELPPFYCNSPENYKIGEIIPSSDNRHLLVVVRLNKIKTKVTRTEIDVMGKNENDEQTENEKATGEILEEIEENEWKTILYLYYLYEDGLVKCDEPLVKFLTDDETPVEIIMLPKCDSSGRIFGGNDTENGVFVMTCEDGKLRIVSIKTLTVISEVGVADDRFVSATYCKSLERLCGCTAKGCLHFYSFYDLDADSSDERDDDVSCVIENSGKLIMDKPSTMPSLLKYDATPSTSSSPAQPPSGSTNANPTFAGDHNYCDVLLAFKSDMSMNTLKILYSLTLFNEMLTPYTAEVPGCWSELEQAQKQRRHPQHLRPGDDTHLTKTWRLHNGTTTLDEHLIELSLPKCTSLGHIDFKFSLYQPCTNAPAIQVTLLKQKSTGLCSRRKSQSINRVDESINFNIGSTDGKNSIENPVLSEEYLNARNAEILVGPIELASCMDLSEQAGSVTLTSPKLLKSKGRNYLLHIKTMTDFSKDGQAKTRVPVRKKGITSILLTSFVHSMARGKSDSASLGGSSSTTAGPAIVGKDNKGGNNGMGSSPTLPSDPSSTSVNTNKSQKNDFYIGCDWLNEISITVRSTRQVYKIENERAQRLAMLESNLLLNNLLKILYNYANPEEDEAVQLQQNIVFDILIWIVTIRMMRYRYPKNPFGKKILSGEIKDLASSDINVQQSECIQLVEKHLVEIVRHCIVLGNRSIAHKCVKFVSVALEGAQNMIDKDGCNQFEKTLKQAIVTCLPEIVDSQHAGALRWFTLLISGTSTSDSHSPISEHCISLLKDVAIEMNKRASPYAALLRTRFGLYGSPFDAEIFESQPSSGMRNPNLSFSCSSIGKTGSVANSAAANQHSSIDLRSVCVTDGSELKFLPLQLRRRGIGNHFKGLLEVEPLHYVCSSTSDATRLENIDSNNIQSTNIIDDFLMENTVQNNMETVQNHIKLEEKENLDDDMMNNVKNILVDKIFYSALKKHKLKDDVNEAKKAEDLDAQNEHFNEIESWGPSNEPRIVFVGGNTNEAASIIDDKSQASIALNNKIQEFFEDSNAEENANGLPWHKLLSTPPKQMIVVERMHSGAMRYITLDFGAPIMLTDLIIPACSDLASLFIDIWCFEEEADSVRLVVSLDIGSRTLVLSDLQPPPICRYLKITITGRYGMSATRCRMPMGSFYGHIVILDHEGYADPVMKYLKNKKSNLPAQVKILKALYEDVHCRYCLSNSKLIDMLQPYLNSEASNISHMQAFLNRIKESGGDHAGSANPSVSAAFQENHKVYAVYEECMAFQHQLNVIKRVIDRIRAPLDAPEQPKQCQPDAELPRDLSSIYTDKLRVLSECLIETLLHLITTYGGQNVANIYSHFDQDTCNLLFDTLVINGDTHIQLATCSILVRMCCFKPWWGEFLAEKFLKLYSSQNSRIFPQDRVFFLLTYLGRKSISMGSCRSIVIDGILKALATLLAPISANHTNRSNIWCNTDLNLIGWILLFLSVCLDEGVNDGKKDPSNMRWDFMSGETDMAKSRLNMGNGSLRTLTRTFKKRFLPNKHYTTPLSGGVGSSGISSNIVAEKMYMMNTDSLQTPASKLEMALKQHENQLKKLQNSVKQSFGVYINEITKNKPAIRAPANDGSPRAPPNYGNDKDNGSDSSSSESNETAFDKGLKSLKIGNIIVVIRGLIGLILNMDFTCNMDLFLITCKIIARLVLACRPVVQLSKIITTNQLLQLVRIAVWENQQQPWAVHAITCLLQDILEADKNFKDEDNDSGNSSGDEAAGGAGTSSGSSSELPPPIRLPPVPETAFKPVVMHNSIPVSKEISYADAVKNQLPSLMECDDADMEELLILDDMLEREKRALKKYGSNTNGRDGLMFLYKTVSSAMDARLEIGLDTNVEIILKRLALKSTFNLIAILPHVAITDAMNANQEDLAVWPESIVEPWSGVEYQQGLETNIMLTEVFDNILGDLHLIDSWLNLEKILQLWLTLNGETLEQVPGSNAPGLNAYSFPKIPFGDRAVHGLLKALATHSNIKLRAWCLGFQCLILACKPHFEADYMDANSTSSDNHFRKMGNLIVNDDNFEKMLLRFFSGVDQSISSLDSNRYAGPTVCKLVLELFVWLELKCNVKDKLKEILLKVILHLVQFGGAISNQQGPIDAQSQLIKELLYFSYDKSDLGVAMSIIECVSCLVYNNIVNVDKLYCIRASETSNSNNMFGTRFGSLFATVLGSENSRQCKTVTDNTLLIDLLKLASILVNTKNPRTGEDNATAYDNSASFNDLNTSNESQTDEIKAEQQNIEPRPKTPCFADTVLQHSPTMIRLLSSLSHCSNSSFAMLVASSMSSSALSDSKNNTLSEPQTVADAVFQLLLYLSRTATQNILVVKPLFDYINYTASMRHAMPKLQLSEPFLWFILKVLETSASVAIFADMGGIKVLCESLVRSNRTLINTQPSLVSMIMQRLSKSSNLQTTLSSSSKKSSSSSTRNEDGLINFAPYCTISSENQTAQPADVLIQAPIASHRRARNPAWSYLFYPNESHVDLTITLPTAVLLKEVQLQPHLSTLASCPSAVAIEITRDSNLGPIPITQPISTVGMTCIRLKFAQPEIATSVIIRLYRPRDASNIGLTQISVLGTTTFSDVNYNTGGPSWATGSNIAGPSTSNASASGIKPPNDSLNEYQNDDDKVARTSLGWLRILAQCFSVVIYAADQQLTNRVIDAATEVPGFLEACCSLLNIAPYSPNFALQNLETVLLKLGLHNRDLGLKLINILLKESIPQMFQLSNDSISDLLYHLCTTQNDFTQDRLEALLGWVQQLHDTYRKNQSNHFVMHATNPYSGFIKCLASILWQAHAIELIPNLYNMISKELFETLYDWNQELEHDEPLKKAIDAVLCSICCIRPELFTMLLKRMGVLVPNLSTDLTASISDDRKDGECTTDDVKQEESDSAEWYSHLVIEDVSKMNLSKSHLATISLACQSPLAMQQLIDSGLPNLLTSVVLEFCHWALVSINQLDREKSSSNEPSVDNDNRETLEEEQTATAGYSEIPQNNSETSCLTDADKEHHKYSGNCSKETSYPMVNIQKVTEILNFFTDVCSEGLMRDWLGCFEGSIFWEPLLLLLCNNKLAILAPEVTPQACLDLEECLIKFLSKVTACHPKNQEVLTVNLISVIRKSDTNGLSTITTGGTQANNRVTNGNKSCISGFTRRLVLQILLESEKILVTVRSDLPLHNKDQNTYTVSNHPSKRPNAHFLLFYLSTNAKCQEILDQCATVYNQLVPNFPSDSRVGEILTGATSNVGGLIGSATGNSDSRKELWEMGLGMEFLSVAAGVTAKDKRLKEAKNQATTMKQKDILSMFKMKIDDPKLTAPEGVTLTHTAVPNGMITSDTTISQILAMLKSTNVSLSTPCISMNLIETKGKTDLDLICESSSGSSSSSPILKAADFIPLPSPLQIFSSRGGLSLLAHYLPTVYPETPKAHQQFGDKDKNIPPGGEWVKVEQNEEIYEDLDDISAESSPKAQAISAVPQHSLTAFALFLKLPAYSEVLLRDKVRAQCLLRLILGVTGDGEGNEIYSLALSSSLPTLPFEVFRQLLDSSPLTTDDGVLLRRMVIEVGAIHLVLNCLSIFTHHNGSGSSGSNSSDNIQATANSKPTNSTNAPAAVPSTANGGEEQLNSDDKSHMYWAKGTGFGTGSTQRSWNIEQALLRQKSEEEHVTVLLQVLSSYINPGDKLPTNMDIDEPSYRECSETLPELPPIFLDLLQQSCLIPALSSYLRNDSVLDITRHIPLYRAILQLLRAISLSTQLMSLLVNKDNEGKISIAVLLSNMKACVDTYASRLKVNKKSNLKGQTQKITVSLDDGDDEGLALLIPDIQETSLLVQSATNLDASDAEDEQKESVSRPLAKSVEDKYMELMKALQFDTFEMIAETENGYRFTISHHFETNVRMAGDRGHPGRVKRLAQETVTLSTSLPLSYSSSVFVRCDTDRLDIMKVLITGPAETPYANGCFEFDVYFPPDYPNSPMMINLETTGRNTVRFNPNLYNDGKVCLSVLNTWHGRPEEKWNSHTSSFLQVLVSIQSLILVPEPYFNEPGFERSRGTPNGTHSSREYNSNIYQACVRYAMLEQLKNPCPCFKEVIQTHFWLKRNEICAQIEDWIAELSKPLQKERTGRTISFNAMVLRRQYRQLREELAKLAPPEGLDELDYPFHAGITPTTPSAAPYGSSTINTATSAVDDPPQQESGSMNIPPAEPPLEVMSGLAIIGKIDMIPDEEEDDDDAADSIIELEVGQDDDDAQGEGSVTKPDEEAGSSSSSSNGKETSIPDELQQQEGDGDLSPEEIVLSMVW
ncbi:baculoviral IAP repeat-containing protein 6-like isoform X1 [Uranotaenia lowii]|uniref:baculoviral IAP repeat-containing protein 6-like isoform X1 n=2 Tax=Uranotaenia lowii TaxID=190385 RepID=UPI00247A2FD7|nr:baculoviral IAP repeat-containing protein 6-like isoform X1 [Uranotaenia lowii]XP_055591806.1 baculoviral IAP repeat-containing protein 6-like isoform X1 [Uranotaenia lowii]